MMGMYEILLKGFELLDKWETKILVCEGLQNLGTKIEMELEYKIYLTVRQYYGQDTGFEGSMVLVIHCWRQVSWCSVGPEAFQMSFAELEGFKPLAGLNIKK